MRKKKLFEEIRRDPARIYRCAADVLRDRRFDDAERLAILQAWDASPGAAREEIAPLIAELQARLDPRGHAAE